MSSKSWGKHVTPALLLGALVLFFAMTPAAAQKLEDLPPPPPAPKPKPKPSPTPSFPEGQDYEVLRVTSNLVVVPVSVTDAKGQAFLGLKASDFRIEEEGRPQELAQIGDPEQVPLDIAVLLDVSSSVTKKFDFEQQAATRFLKQVLKPADTATIFAIDDRPRLEQTRTTAETASAKLLTIRAATGPSPTAFYDTVIAAAGYLANNTPPQHRRVIVVISDGEDNYSDSIREAELAAYNARVSEKQGSSLPLRPPNRAALEAARLKRHQRAQAEVQRAVQRADAAFYSINPSGESYKLNLISTRAQVGMEQLAQVTGGNSFVSDSPEDLDTVFRQIAAELRAQYLLQYYANASPASQFLRIKVSVPSHTELHVRARQGYYPKRKG